MAAMAKKIAVVNQKGGVGKTTTSVNLAASLAFLGQSVLLADLDPQANATSGLGFDKKLIEGTVYDAMLGEAVPETLVRKTALERLMVLPSNIHLIGAEIELIHAENREWRFAHVLQTLENKFPTILFDCPPSLGLLTLNALCAADSVLIPIQCEYYALEGLSQLLDTITRVRESLNPNLTIEGVVFTMYDSRVRLASDVIGEIQKMFQDKVYATMIPRNVRLAEAPSFGKPAILYDFASRGAQSYLSLAKEFILRNNLTEGMPQENGSAPVLTEAN